MKTLEIIASREIHNVDFRNVSCGRDRKDVASDSHGQPRTTEKAIIAPVCGLIAHAEEEPKRKYQP
jgi:hypothetical protein